MGAGACFVLSVPASAQEAEQIEEQVDEIQVELESGEDGGLGRHLGVVAVVGVEGLDLLGVVGGEAQEDGDADEAVDPVHGREAGNEHGQEGKDQQEDESAHQHGADAGQVGLGGVAEGGHGAEVQGGDAEHDHQAHHVKDDEVDREGHAGEGGVGEEQEASRRHGQAVDPCGEHQYHHQLGDEQSDIGEGVEQEQEAEAGDIPGDGHAEGDGQAGKHPEEGAGGVTAHGLHHAVAAVPLLGIVVVFVHGQFSFPREKIPPAQPEGHGILPLVYTVSL